MFWKNKTISRRETDIGREKMDLMLWEYKAAGRSLAKGKDVSLNENQGCATGRSFPSRMLTMVLPGTLLPIEINSHAFGKKKRMLLFNLIFT